MLDLNWKNHCKLSFPDFARIDCIELYWYWAKDVKDKSIEERIDIWINRYQFLVDRWQKLLTDIKSSDVTGFITYSVVLRELFDFAQAA